MAVNWEGGWSGGTGSLITYYEGDLVVKDNIVYIGKNTIPAGSPPPESDMSNWAVFASSGSSGLSGSSGSSGFSGSSGTSGTGFTAISNASDNRILTSDGSGSAANAETNMTFDGNTLNVDGSLFITGSFSVAGSSSTINTTTLVVSDPIISIGNSQSGNPLIDEGLMFVRGSGATQAFIWDESEDTFALIQTDDDHTVIGNVSINSYSNLRVGGLTTSQIKITNGAQANYVLASDSSGLATWTQSINFGSGFGTTNYIPKWQSPTSLSSTSSIYDSGSVVSIGCSVSIGWTVSGATLDILSAGNLTTPLRIRYSGNDRDLLKINGLGKATFAFDVASIDGIVIDPQNSELSMLSYGGLKMMSMVNSQSYFGHGVGSYKMGIGNNSPQARLDITAQGASSSDIAFRVRNNGNTYNIVDVQGDSVLNVRLSNTSTNPSTGLNLLGTNQDTIINAKSTNTSGSNKTGFEADSANNGIKTGLFVDYGSSLGSSSAGFLTYQGNAKMNFGNFTGNTNGWAFLQTTSSTFTVGNTVFAIYSTNAQSGGGTLALGTTLGTTIASLPASTYGKNTFFIANGTAPTTTGADAFGIYSADIVAGNAAPHFRTENGSIIKLYNYGTVSTVQGITNALTSIGILGTSSVSSQVITGPYSTNYILQSSDTDAVVEITTGASVSVTVPPNSDVAFSNGSKILIARGGTGSVQIIAGTGVSLLSSNDNKFLQYQYSVATLIKKSTNTWWLFGDLSST